MKITTDFIKTHAGDSQVFVETGSYQGDTTYNASLCNFKEVHSIELSDFYHSIVKTRFENNPNVHIHLGSSSDILGSVIENINEKIIFWLDGHYSGGNTAKGDKYCPLEEELNWIKSHKIKNHVIMIDDIRLAGTEWILPLDSIKKLIKEINENYEFEMIDTDLGKNDILIAKIFETSN